MESTLSLKYSDLAGEVGLFLGFGRGADNGDTPWTTKQQAAIDSCVKSGLRNFYFPPPVEGSQSSYDWSFLKPTRSLPFASGVSTVALPDDFGGFEGPITISSTTASVPWDVPLVGEGSVRQKHAEQPAATGRPVMAAIQPLKGTTQGEGQRFQLALWPLADQAYTLQFAYYILADCLTGSRPYAYGGAAHVETILESCLAIAEQRLDDASSVHTMKFAERLLASISLDRRYKPQRLGQNLDRSDWREMRSRHCGNGVTLNGIEY